MKNFKTWFIFTAKRFAALFPSKLPTKGAAELDVFCASIFDLYGIPDMPSYRHAIATMIMHLGPQADRKSKSFFARSVKKAMANQIAYELIDHLRKEEKKSQQLASQKEPLALEPQA